MRIEKAAKSSQIGKTIVGARWECGVAKKRAFALNNSRIFSNSNFKVKKNKRAPKRDFYVLNSKFCIWIQNINVSFEKFVNERLNKKFDYGDRAIIKNSDAER